MHESWEKNHSSVFWPLSLCHLLIQFLWHALMISNGILDQEQTQKQSNGFQQLVLKSVSWEIKASSLSHGHTSNTVAKNKDEKKANIYTEYKSRWLR